MSIGRHFGLSLNNENSSSIICQCSNSGQFLNQNDLNNRYQFLSLYHTIYTLEKTVLFIYDTENWSKGVKIYETQIIDESTSMTQLPNGELFCYGKSRPDYGITLIIDRNYGFRMLPVGTPCSWSSALYFENNIYCFGGYNEGAIALSTKFDFNKNRWIDLAPIPKADYFCHSVIFNANLLISAFSCNNLWLYSTEIDSFSTIPYYFAWDVRKFLINVEKLYLIEWDYNGLIYESEDEYHWKPISKSQIFPIANQMYCLYNKENVYISASERYYQFDLKKKVVFEFKI